MGCLFSSPNSNTIARPPIKKPASTREKEKPQFNTLYTLGEKLGSGQYATVHRAIRKKDNAVVAVKCVRKDRLSKEDLEGLAVEIKAMEMLSQHRSFVHYYDFFSDGLYFFIVLELISGGELFDRICQKEKYSEREARQVIWLMANAIAYAHSKGIAHRDLKPENVLLSDANDDTSVKIADLGFAKILESPSQLMTTSCGTPGYVAPEVISGQPYSPACDCWSLGVIFYILLCGYPPFAQEDQSKLFKAIKSGKYTMDPADWGLISDGAKDLVRRLLVVDPRRRLTAAQILQHPWMRADITSLPNVSLDNSVQALRRFQARRRLRKAMQAVRMTIRTRMIVAAKAVKEAKAAGKTEDEVQSIFFTAARNADPSKPVEQPVSLNRPEILPSYSNQFNQTGPRSPYAAVPYPQSASPLSPQVRTPTFGTEASIHSLNQARLASSKVVNNPAYPTMGNNYQR